ncbi:MAG: DedA family protein [Candidatus Schekmanbacteria bacterium]|nr:DedA family protein [Candidatus Schekmanbacteria bacterium]
MTDKLIAFLLSNENVLGYSVLLASSVIEYVFPPFPGDTVTLFGAFLIATRGWNFTAVLASVTLGSITGSCIDYYLGRKIGGAFVKDNGKTIAAGSYGVLTVERYNYVKEKFDKYGALIIVMNRFMPGVRAFFFIVAGITGMSIWSVQAYNLISVILWNVLIIWAGMLIGNNWERLLSLSQAYSTILGILVVIFIVVFVVKYFRKKN